jgi:hypothetical protein
MNDLTVQLLAAPAPALTAVMLCLPNLFAVVTFTLWILVLMLVRFVDPRARSGR